MGFYSSVFKSFKFDDWKLIFTQIHKPFTMLSKGNDTARNASCVLVSFLIGFLLSAIIITYQTDNGVLSINRRLGGVPSAPEIATWGETHGILLESKNVPYDCQYNNNRMCCSALEPRAPSYSIKNRCHGQLSSLNSSSSSKNNRQKNRREVCKLHREYISSPYELRHILKAKDISSIINTVKRREALVEFITSQDEIDSANIWLRRVKVRMAPGNGNVEVTSEDEEFLSKFRITKTCGTGRDSLTNVTWYEWIEPLAVFGRHPFAMSNCANPDVEALSKKRKNYPGAVELMNVDYILTQSAKSFYNNTVNKLGQQNAGHPVREFLLDAGSHSFESSLIWLTCAYSQVRKPSFLPLTLLPFSLLPYSSLLPPSLHPSIPPFLPPLPPSLLL
jgi:hypothetical protein